MDELDPAHVEAVAAWFDSGCRTRFKGRRAHCETHDEPWPCSPAKACASFLMTCEFPDVREALLAAVAPLIEALVREAQAEAWADGFNAATDAVPEDVWFGSWSYTRNPYRDEESDA